jgi:hypothetical protein
MSLTEIVRALLARNGGAAESVTLKQNARGETQPEVTAVVREGEVLWDAASRAASVYAQLVEQFAPRDTLLADLQASVKP